MERTPGARTRRTPGFAPAKHWALALLALAPLAPGVARAQQDTVIIVQVERERPEREKQPTLRFLKANRDFIRSRLDRLRLDQREGHTRAEDLDPRFLTYRQLLADVAQAKDSVTRAADARERELLFQRIEHLAHLENELDQLEQLIGSQQARLAFLQADFAGRQRTELEVVLTGGPIEGEVDSVSVTLEDGSRVVAALDDTQRRSLRYGGALRVFRGLVEPRAQSIEVRLVGEGWTQTGPGHISLDPPRDRLTMLKLDLAKAHPSRGLASVVASTWQFEPVPHAPPTAAEPDPDRP